MQPPDALTWHAEDLCEHCAILRLYPAPDGFRRRLDWLFLLVLARRGGTCELKGLTKERGVSITQAQMRKARRALIYLIHQRYRPKRIEAERNGREVSY